MGHLAPGTDFSDAEGRATFRRHVGGACAVLVSL